MSVVGNFPGVQNPNRRTVRGAVNPMDKSTVISILPKEIIEIKHTIQPGTFHILPGSYEKPALLVVGPSSWWREIDEEQPLLEIPTSSIQIADSIVKDYCNGIFACNMADTMPGLFYVPGEHTLETLRKNFLNELNAANVRQRNWYVLLMKLADSLWARSNGNPLAISDDMRLAARQLGQTAKDWMRDFSMIEMIRCVACGALRNPDFPVCGSCHAIIDKKKAEELGLAFVK